MPLRDMDREQMWMLPPTLDELLPLDHPARFVAEFVDALGRDGWSELGVEIGGDPLGAPAYHPRALLSVWLYGFMTGVRSCRKLDAACRDQISYLWLTGWQHPDHNTLWRFYKGHRQAMRKLFERTVRTAVTMKLVDLAVQAEARRRFLKDPYHKDRFIYDEQSDSFTCPQGQTLAFVRIQHANGVSLQLYRASGGVCQACPAFRVCTRAKEIGRSLAIGPHDAVLRRHRAWMATSAAKQAYKLRKQLVEPVFGIIKEQQGARRFLLRGLVNVAAEWTVLATAFNLRTLWRAWRSRAFIQLPHGPNLHPAS